MGARHVPNDSLRLLLTEARWTGGDLARAVNSVATESGLRLNYRRASTAQWLSGGSPRPPVPELVAEALSRVLRRPVAAADAGFRAGRPGGEEDVAVAELLARLGSPHRRDLLRYSVYRLGLLSAAGLDEATLAPSAHRDGGRVGRAEVEAAARALQLFSDAEGALGAGMVRPSLADYLAHTVSPWLRAGSPNGEVHRQLLSVSADLAYLCGFLCFDDELHGNAQHYYRAALRLAAEAGDVLRHAITLRAMSVQARSLGHHREALHLAETAIETGGPKASPRTRAFLLGQVAVAAAATGDRRHATARLRATERALAGAAGAAGVIGAYHRGSLAHQRAVVAACLGDKTRAIGELRESVKQRPPGEYRSRALILARLAELLLDHGHVDEAVATWHRFLDIYPAVRSGRADSAMAVLRARTRSHQNIPAAKALSRRAADLSTVLSR